MTGGSLANNLNIQEQSTPTVSEKLNRLGAEVHCRNQGIMRGLSGERLLRRFLGRIQQLSEDILAPGVGSTDQADGEATRISVNGSNGTGTYNEMSGYRINLELASSENTYFRKVLFTGLKSQLVLMALQPGEDIGPGTLPNADQFIRVESGHGTAVIGERTYDLVDSRDIFVPAGYEHNVINTSPDALLKVYVIYTPPRYPDGTVHKTKSEAQAAHHHEGAGI